MSSREYKIIEFSQDFGERDIRLIEVDESLASHIQGGGNISIVGNISQKDAVLCTDSASYAMRRVETSNHLFITEDTRVCAQSNYHYELVVITPQPPQHIIELLKQTALKSILEEQQTRTINTHLLDRNELQSMMLCSSDEFNKIIQRMGVIEINSKMRMVSISALVEVFAEILDLALIRGWGLRMKQQDCFDAMTSVDNTLIEYALSKMGSRAEESPFIWELSPERVFQACARVFIHSQSSSQKVLCKYLWQITNSSHSFPGLLKSSKEIGSPDYQYQI